MNTFGLSLVWLALQITVLCVISVPVYFLARRNSPSGGATASFSVLMLVALLTLAAISPWPRWSFAESNGAEGGDGGRSGLSEAISAPASTGLDARESADSAVLVAGDASTRLAERLHFFREAFVEQLSNSRAPTEAGLNWIGWLAVAFSVGAGVAVLRLILGLVAVAAQRRRSGLVTNDDMLALLDVLCAEFQCRRHIELRESDEIISAATIGWRRPVILLPPEWQTWTNAERRSVMAHEIAHISQNDFLCWVCAQLGLLLHFYHPLVHWLANRLRLEQELAADALAAAHSGGAKPYLKTLAELALRQADRPVAWPARTFLPTRGTLTRRVEMLRDSGLKPLSLMASRWRRGLVICTLLAATGLLSGVRPPDDIDGLSTASAQDVTGPAGPNGADQFAQNDRPAAGATGTATADGAKFSLKYVPPNTSVVFGIRPSAVSELPMFRPIMPMFEQGLNVKETGIKVRNYSQILVAAFGTVANANPLDRPPVFIITHHEAAAVAGTLTLLGATHFEDVEHGGKKLKVSGGAHAIYQPDDVTVIQGPRRQVEFLIDSTKLGVGMPLWHKEFETVAANQLVYLVDMNSARPYVEEMMTGGKRSVRGPAPPRPAAGPIGMAQAFAPLWKDTTVVAAGITFGQTSEVDLVAWCDGDESAERVEQTLQSLIPLARNLLSSAKESMKSAPPEAQGPISSMLVFSEELLTALKVGRDGKQVTASTQTEAGTLPVMLGLMLPAIQSARMAARRAQASNNIKQIMLAFHNYHAKHSHFPAAAVVGPDGKTKHSWRVALLPFLGQQELYDSYKLDEPWDSPDNLKLQNAMPQVYRDPNSSPDATHTSYVGLVGEGTGLGNGEESVRIRDMKDGTSNTIMVVETTDQVAWTSLTDIKYDPEADLPKLGFLPGIFTAGLADGAALVISLKAEETVRAMITRNGGEDLRQLPPARPTPVQSVLPEDRPIRPKSQN